MKTVALTVSMNESDFFLRRRYTDWILSAGALPVILPPTFNIRAIREYANAFDGFILTGGGDIDPLLYGEEKEKACGAVHRLRDEFEIALLRQIASLDKPTLGICRGMQVMNVAFGGTLWQDIKTAGFPTHESEQNGHKVNLSGEFSHIFEKESIGTNSYHHQSVKRLGKELEAVAWSEDGLIEGIWHGTLRFFAGVQWHPELEPNEYSEKLVRSFTATL